MLSIPEDDDAIHPTTIVARGNAPVKTRGVASNVHAKKLSVYREFDAPPDDDDDKENGRREHAIRSARPSRRRRAPAATYGDWFDGDDAELEKMVDEFQNEQQEQETNVREVGDRVRESVAELCGALDELIEEEDAISNGRASVPSLREQLVDSWQGKSYYERLQNVVDADAEQRKKASLSSADSKNKPRKKQPLSSINLNSANYTADGQQQQQQKKKKPSTISLLQPLYKNQGYMIPQKALDLSRSTITQTTPKPTPNPPSGARAQLSNALAELTNLAVPDRQDERAAIRGDLLRIIEVCQKKLAACAANA